VETQWEGMGQKPDSGKIIEEEATVFEFQRMDRWDGERSILGSNFMAMFPHFVTLIWQYQAELGIILEDTLQCAGRITYDQRQFRNDKKKGCSRNLKSLEGGKLCTDGGSEVKGHSGVKDWYIQDICVGSLAYARALQDESSPIFKSAPFAQFWRFSGSHVDRVERVDVMLAKMKEWASILRGSQRKSEQISGDANEKIDKHVLKAAATTAANVMAKGGTIDEARLVAAKTAQEMGGSHEAVAAASGAVQLKNGDTAYQALRRDFHAAFRFEDIEDGVQRLKGTMLSPDQVLEVKKDFETPTVIHNRLDKIKQNIVAKSYQLRGQDITQIFPLPFQYSSGLVIKLGAQFGLLSQSAFCLTELNPNPEFKFTALHRIHGYSFVRPTSETDETSRANQLAKDPSGIVSSEPCLGGEFAMTFDQVQMGLEIEACKRTIESNRDLAVLNQNSRVVDELVLQAIKENSVPDEQLIFKIKIQSVLASEKKDLIDSAFSKVDDGLRSLEKKISGSDTQEKVGEDDLTSTLGWGIANDLIKDPSKFLGSGNMGDLSGLPSGGDGGIEKYYTMAKTTFGTFTEEIKERAEQKLKDFSLGQLSELSSEALAHAKEQLKKVVSLQAQGYRTFNIELTFTKDLGPRCSTAAACSGRDSYQPWQYSVSAFYGRHYSLNLGLGIPGIASTKTAIKLSLLYDFSGVVTAQIALMKRIGQWASGSIGVYGQCMQCLENVAVTQNVFCRVSDTWKCITRKERKQEMATLRISPVQGKKVQVSYAKVRWLAQKPFAVEDILTIRDPMMKYLCGVGSEGHVPESTRFDQLDMGSRGCSKL